MLIFKACCGRQTHRRVCPLLILRDGLRYVGVGLPERAAVLVQGGEVGGNLAVLLAVLNPVNMWNLTIFRILDFIFDENY